MNLHEIEEKLDRLGQKPIPPLYELACCAIGLVLLALACWMFLW